MKKLLLALVLLLTLCGCGSKSEPKEIVNKELKTIKTTLLDEVLSAAELEVLSTSQKAYLTQLYKLLFEFNYSVDSVEEKGDTATVKATIKTFDMIEVFAELNKDEEIASRTLELQSNYTAEKEEELMAVYAIKITQILNTFQKTYSVVLEIPCVKVDNTWSIDPNYDLKNDIAAVASSALLKLSDTGE